MLELKNLVKTYKTKGGVEVHALDNVSVEFPEKGMVFLLGKSGSGKSTLLNVAGGLDKPDSGEIIIKGKNSKSFSGSDFDSYRNTFIGFIFQEYNILNEFNIEQNISLALQLQGKPNDKATVEKFLADVDLSGLGKRKPNTLSGGQKQRVAIARALIKNPEIIMADEPTGALDSNTGKQVFDTLKKLSADKLVIVVSHDRDFAEIYADRIIELKDGKILSDVTKETTEAKAVTDNVNIINDHTVSIKDVSRLNDKDMKDILETLKSGTGSALISSGDHDVNLVRQAIHINDDDSSHHFDETTRVDVQQYDGKDTKFIRSHLPLSRAFKMGTSSLKVKPFKMIFTSILTIVALTMFGVVSTLMLYDPAYSLSQALSTSTSHYEQINKVYKIKYQSIERNNSDGSEKVTYEYENKAYALFGSQEIKDMNDNDVGHKFAGVFNFNGTGLSSDSAVVTLSIPDAGSPTNLYYQVSGLYGLTDAGADYMAANNFSLVDNKGRYPENKDEIAISNYTYEVMKASSTSITSVDNVIGTTFNASVYGSLGSQTASLKVTGIYDVGGVPSEYDVIKNSTTETQNTKAYKDAVEKYRDYLPRSYNCLGYVDPSFYDYYAPLLAHNNDIYVNTDPAKGLRLSTDYPISETPQANETGSFYSTSIVKNNKNAFTFFDLKGKAGSYNESMSDEQVYCSINDFQNIAQISYYYYFFKVSEVIERYIFDSTAYGQLSVLSSEQRENLSQASGRLANYYSNNDYYPEGFDKNNDFNAINSLIQNHYVNIAKNDYIYTIANSYKDAFESRNVTPYPTDYNQFKGKLGNVEFKLNDSSLVTLSDIQALDSYLNTHNDNLLKSVVLVNEAQNYFNKNSAYFESKNQICKKFLSDNENLTQTELDTLTAYVTEPSNINLKSATYNPSCFNTEINFFTPTVFYKNSNGSEGTLEVIGYYSLSNNRYSNGYIITNNFLKTYGIYEGTSYYTASTTDYVKPEDARYNRAITVTDFNQNQISNLTANHGTYSYSLTNATSQIISMFLSMINTLQLVFLIMGIVFGVFAALMLLNFIANSISSKTKDIGILRAVGARGSDLFKIFFSESGVISAICSVLAIIISGAVCYSINNMMGAKLGIKLLDFNLVNVGIIIGGALIIAVLGTYLPVLIASKKQPVESIRTL
jgi:ABC-type lipoprotein export system ATPase subunit